MLDKSLGVFENQKLIMKSDIITAEDMKAKVKLNEERCQMKVEDCMSQMQREVIKFRLADQENKKFKAELLRQKDQWARNVEERQRQLDQLIE